MVVLIILALIVPQSLAAVLSPTCRDVKAVENFNITTIGSGVWYEIARYPNSFELLDKCVSIEYSHQGDSVNMKLRNVPVNSIYSIESIAKYADDAKKSGDLSLAVKYGWPLVSLELPVKVLALDNDQYAIFYACLDEKNTSGQQEYAWIFSRSVTLEGVAKKEVEEFLRSSEAIDVKKLSWVDNSSAACKFSSIIENLPNKFLNAFNV